MAFARAVRKKNPPGRVYVIQLTLDDIGIIHKIGMCHADRSADRMMEILRSWFMHYRYVPHSLLRLDHETKDPYKLEKHIHKVLEDFKWVPDIKVDGAQEMFKDLDEEEVIEYIKTVKL